MVNMEDFKKKTFHRGEVHREMYIRQTKLACYNFSRNDFKDDDDKSAEDKYNDYLANVEDLAFELTYNWNNPEVVKTCETKIKKWKEKFASRIKCNAARLDRERLVKKQKLNDERLIRKREKKKLDAARSAQTGGVYKRQLAALKLEMLDQKRPVAEVMADMKVVIARRDQEKKEKKDSEDALQKSAGPSHEVLKQIAETERIAEEIREKENARVPHPPYKYRRALVFNGGPRIPATPMFAASAPFVETKHVSRQVVQLLRGEV